MASWPALTMTSAHHLVARGGHLAAAGDDADLAFLDLLETERRRGPADIDLARHDGGERGRRAAGLGGLGLEAVGLDEAEHEHVGGGARGRVGDGGLLRRLLEALQGAVRLDVPVEVVGADRGRADDAHRRTLGEGRHGAGRCRCATPMSTAPAITVCMVSPPPRCIGELELRPCFLKMPARVPISAIAVSQLPRWPMASLACRWAATPPGRASDSCAARQQPIQRDAAFHVRPPC